MVNKAVFSQQNIVRNHAGGKAHEKSAEQALTQFVMTGTFNNTYYVSGADQLTVVLEKSKAVSDEFLAKLAIYSREKGLMKDMPAVLCGLLVGRSSEYADVVFDRVIDNAKMLRNFVQVMRSGVVGRRSLGSKAKRLVKKFIANLNDYALWDASVGNDPSLVDVMKLAHPKATSEARNALYAYVMGKPVDMKLLPDFIRDYEGFIAGDTKEAPLRVPFQKLTAMPLTSSEWARIAKNAKWQMTRMNLNTFARHGVFKDKEMVKMIADRLQDRESIFKARAFPYQLMSAMLNIGDGVPVSIKKALEAAMEISLENVPVIDGRVVIAIDVSGSMGNSVTGHRPGATSKVSCLDVAALIGASLRNRNSDARVLVFDGSTKELNLGSMKKVMTISEKIKTYRGGSTNCGSVIQYMFDNHIKVDSLIMISDNESWEDKWNSDLSTLWRKYKNANPEARMINLDITPNETSVSETNRPDTLMVGGFSDEVFTVMSQYLNDNSSQVDAVLGIQL